MKMARAAYVSSCLESISPQVFVLVLVSAELRLLVRGQLWGICSRRNRRSKSVCQPHLHPIVLAKEHGDLFFSPRISLLLADGIPNRAVTPTA